MENTWLLPCKLLSTKFFSPAKLCLLFTHDNCSQNNRVLDNRIRNWKLWAELSFSLAAWKQPLELRRRQPRVGGRENFWRNAGEVLECLHPEETWDGALFLAGFGDLSNGPISVCWHFHFYWGTSLNVLLGDRTQSGWLSLTAMLCCLSLWEVTVVSLHAMQAAWPVRAISCDCCEEWHEKLC